MIVGIINGYYRSGTTLMQRLYKLSNLNHIVLCEPTQHEIIDFVMSNGCYKQNVLHGWTIFEDYCKLPREVRHEFIARHFEVFDKDKRQWGIMTDFGAVRYLLQPLHDCDLPIVIKSCQLHLFLDKLIRWLDCWVVHLVRPAPKVIASHFNPIDLYGSNKAREILLGNKGVVSFYCDAVYENLTYYLKVDKNKARHNLDKLVFNILTVNRIASGFGLVNVVNFETFIRDPVKEAKYLPFKLNSKVFSYIDLSKDVSPPDWLVKEVLKSVDYLGV